MKSTILKQGNQDRGKCDYKKFKKYIQSPENTEMEKLSKVIKNYLFEAEEIPAGRGKVRII